VLQAEVLQDQVLQDQVLQKQLRFLWIVRADLVLCTASDLLCPGSDLLCPRCGVWRTGPGRGNGSAGARRCSGTGSKGLVSISVEDRQPGSRGQSLPVRARFLFSLGPTCVLSRPDTTPGRLTPTAAIHPRGPCTKKGGGLGTGVSLPLTENCREGTARSRPGS
jgi:hypothetical protein